MIRCMNEWMHGQLEEQLDAWRDGQTVGQIDGWTGGRINGWMGVSAEITASAFCEQPQLSVSTENKREQCSVLVLSWYFSSSHASFKEL